MDQGPNQQDRTLYVIEKAGHWQLVLLFLRAEASNEGTVM
jgi:hypothetical protein